MLFCQLGCYRYYDLLKFFLALPVTRHLRNPDHLVVQLLSYALEKNEPQIMHRFAPIRAQKLTVHKNPSNN